MALDYFMYSTKTGECISTVRYTGMPFIWEQADNFTHLCVVKGDLEHIKEWTIDKNSELWKEEMKKPPMMTDNDLFLYCSKEDVLNLAMIPGANAVIVDIMNKHDSEGLIVRIF